MYENVINGYKYLHFFILSQLQFLKTVQNTHTCLYFFLKDMLRYIDHYHFGLLVI